MSKDEYLITDPPLKAVRDLIIVLSVMGKATVYAGFDTIF